MLIFTLKLLGINRLFVTFLLSIPSIINIGAILLLVVFVFAIIGMILFGHVIRTGQMNENVNYETFAKSFLLTFRLCTASGWDAMLASTSIQAPFCDPDYDDLPNGNCGYPQFAYVYYFVYVLLTSQIIVNMFIAVIMENFTDAQEQEESYFSNEDIDEFYAHWAKYDPEASQFIPFEKLVPFLTSLNGRLGMVCFVLVFIMQYNTF